MSEPLTSRQRQVLDYVTRYIKAYGDTPTIREIAKELGLASPGNIHRLLTTLEKKGYIDLTNLAEVTLKAGEDVGTRSNVSSLEAKVYRYLVQKIGMAGTAPSVREIADAVNASMGGVHKALKSLTNKKLITTHEGEARGIALVGPQEDLYPVVFHRVPCSAATFFSSSGGSGLVRSLPLHELIPRFVEADANALFGVELLDSRQLLAFSRGDYILFDRRLDPGNRDVVVFEYDKKVSVRMCFFRKSSQVELIADWVGGEQEEGNDDEDNYTVLAEPIVVNKIEVKIIGVAVAAIMRGSRLKLKGG